MSKSITYQKHLVFLISAVFSFYLATPDIYSILNRLQMARLVYNADTEEGSSSAVSAASAEKTEQQNKIVKRKIIVTAYSSTPDQTDDTPFITANGKKVRDGIVAANFLPFGTKVKMPEIYGEKVFTVEDRMAAKHSGKVDVWMSTRESALKFGVKELEVEILDLVN